MTQTFMTEKTGWTASSQSTLKIGDVFTIEGSYVPLTLRERLTNGWRWVTRRALIEPRLREYRVTATWPTDNPTMVT